MKRLSEIRNKKKRLTPITIKGDGHTLHLKLNEYLPLKSRRRYMRLINQSELNLKTMDARLVYDQVLDEDGKRYFRDENIIDFDTFMCHIDITLADKYPELWADLLDKVTGHYSPDFVALSIPEQELASIGRL